jgi:hypothetical protein
MVHGSVARDDDDRAMEHCGETPPCTALLRADDETTIRTNV